MARGTRSCSEMSLSCRWQEKKGVFSVCVRHGRVHKYRYRCTNRCLRWVPGLIMAEETRSCSEMSPSCRYQEKKGVCAAGKGVVAS